MPARRGNVARFAANRGFMVEETPVAGGYSLLISGRPAQPLAALPEKVGERVMLITSDRFGDGPEELGRLLMKNFIITLLDVAETPGPDAVRQYRRIPNHRRVGSQSRPWKSLATGEWRSFPAGSASIFSTAGKSFAPARDQYVYYCREHAAGRFGSTIIGDSQRRGRMARPFLDNINSFLS